MFQSIVNLSIHKFNFDRIQIFLCMLFTYSNSPILKKLLFFPFFFVYSYFAWAHPIPDIPILGSFSSDGNSTIIIEVDTRCFEEDPESVPFLTKSIFESFTNKQRESLLIKAKTMIEEAIEIRFGSPNWYLPNFQYEFIDKLSGELSEENIVLIQGRYSKLLDTNATFYQIRSKESAAYDLVFSNLINGEPQRRVNVLFPGEESFKLNLSFINGKSIHKKSKAAIDLNPREEEAIEKKREDARSTLFSFGRQGFVHVSPLGLDHILFVLGLFLLSRQWKPIILQVSVFTIAHTITLGLATLDLISAPSHVIEPIIAASIAVVALENLFFPGYRHSRLLIVFFFGLIHGLGFAGALSAFNLDPTSLVIGLLGFNIGVEFGQLAVIAIAAGLTFWVKDKTSYRKFIVIPGSVLIAVFGLYWTIERIFF